MSLVARVLLGWQIWSSLNFDMDEPNVDEPFMSLVGHFMWLVNQTQLDILNAVRAVAKHSAAPMVLH